MKITELREAFANWAIGEPFQNAFEIMQLLTDETPITEAGLRELGVLDELQKKFNVPQPKHVIGELAIINVKTLGKLRCLLLGVGE